MFRRVIAIVLITKIAVYLLGFIAFAIFNNRIFPLKDVFIEQWYRWDSVHYVEIAQHGYVNTGDERFNIVALPLYPYLIFLLTKTGLHPLISGLIISNLSSIFLAIYMAKLISLDFPEEIAVKSVFYLYIFPTAYFLSAAYTEALFFAFELCCFYYARKGRWFLSGFLVFFACLTRIAGIFLFSALLVEYLYQKGFNFRRFKVDILSLFLPIFAFLIYLRINYIIHGKFFAFLEMQRSHWYKSPSFPGKGFLNALAGFFWRTPYEKFMVSLMEIFFALIGLTGSLFAFGIRLSYGVYSLSNWVGITSVSFWLSIPRYTLALFPIFLAFALWGRRQTFNYVFIFSSCLLLSIFTIQFTLGRWAF
ncbi:MAG: mannosyltransferase family protein [Candidatus Omnitrophota bacterium]